MLSPCLIFTKKLGKNLIFRKISLKIQNKGIFYARELVRYSLYVLQYCGVP
jgi:hypothetical protein